MTTQAFDVRTVQPPTETSWTMVRTHFVALTRSDVRNVWHVKVDGEDVADVTGNAKTAAMVACARFDHVDSIKEIK